MKILREARLSETPELPHTTIDLLFSRLSCEYGWKPEGSDYPILMGVRGVDDVEDTNSDEEDEEDIDPEEVTEEVDGKKYHLCVYVESTKSHHKLFTDPKDPNHKTFFFENGFSEPKYIETDTPDTFYAHHMSVELVDPDRLGVVLDI
jgi:hypothetical protein